MMDLAPGILIAAPSMSDPRFARSVVLLAEAGENGALGFVVNRTTEITYAQIGQELGIDTAQRLGPRHALYGGPVSPQRGWVLFPQGDEAATDIANVIDVGPSLAVCSAIEMLERFFTREQESRFRLLLGYAGWGPEQLEEELSQGAWIPFDLDPDLILDTPHDEIWEKALRKMGIDPGAFVLVGGGAKA